MSFLDRFIKKNRKTTVFNNPVFPVYRDWALIVGVSICIFFLILWTVSRYSHSLEERVLSQEYKMSNALQSFDTALFDEIIMYLDADVQHKKEIPNMFVRVLDPR